MGETAERAVGELPLLTRAQVLEESGHDPRFWSYFTPLAASALPGRAVDDDMKRAVINELDPSAYRGSAGRWPMLRAKIRDVMGKLSDRAYVFKTLEGLGAAALTAPAAPEANVWSAIGSVLSSVATGAANIYATRITTSAQRSITATQAQVTLAQDQAAQQIASQQAQLALQQPPPAAAGPSVAVYALLAAAGIGGLLLLMKLMGGR